MKSRINYRKTSFVFDESYGSSPYQFATINTGDPAHPSKSGFVWAMPLAAIFLFGSGPERLRRHQRRQGTSAGDRGKSGEHCKDDPNCFNRIFIMRSSQSRMYSPDSISSSKHAMGWIPT